MSTHSMRDPETYTRLNKIRAARARPDSKETPVKITPAEHLAMSKALDDLAQHVERVAERARQLFPASARPVRAALMLENGLSKLRSEMERFVVAEIHPDVRIYSDSPDTNQAGRTLVETLTKS